MKIFTVIGSWIKTHLVVTIIIGAVAVVGVATLLLFNNTTKLNFTTLPDGSYSCELMFDGKNLDDSTIRDWLQQLTTDEKFSGIINDINISDAHKLIESFNTSFEASYIVKDGNMVTLKVRNGDMTVDFIIYDINSNQFTLSENATSSEDMSEVYAAFQNILNKAVVANQTKDSFTYENFIIVWSVMTLKKPAFLELSNDIEKYPSLGLDLVCKTKVSSEEQTQDTKYKTYDEIIDKYQKVLSLSSKDAKLSVGVTINETYDSNKYLYALYDINNDGIDELILAEDYNVPNPFEIYYLNGNKAVPAIGQLKYNDIADIYENGQISIYVGGGARNDVYKYLGNVKSIKQKVSNWKDFDYVLYYDNWVYGPEYLKYDESKNETSISEADFNDIVSSFGKKLDYSKWDWKTIEVDPSKQYLGKYVGTGSEHAGTSYIELLDNNKVRVNINYCGGWSLYTGNYGFATTDYTDDGIFIYIDSFSILDGIELDMPDSMSFQVDGDKLYTLDGYLGSNNFDCGVSKTFIKSE